MTASSGQHVGGVSDALQADPTLDAVRAAARASAAALKPQPKRGGFRGTGDGDYCPADREHGRMHILSKNRQWCAQQTHDGKPGKTGHAPTRALWPVQFFDDAVTKWRRLQVTSGEPIVLEELPDLGLPDLDITLES